MRVDDRDTIVRVSVLRPHDPVTDRAAALIGELATHKTDEPMLAEPMERLTARLVDAVVWFVASVLMSMVATLLTQLFFDAPRGKDPLGREVDFIHPAAGWIAFVLMLAGLYLYEVLPTVRNGTYFAKARGHLLVVGPDGRPPGLGRATVRWFAFWGPLVASLLFFGATFGTSLGLIAFLTEGAAVVLVALPFVREDKRNVPDLIAGTHVLAVR